MPAGPGLITWSDWRVPGTDGLSFPPAAVPGTLWLSSADSKGLIDMTFVPATLPSMVGFVHRANSTSRYVLRTCGLVHVHEQPGYPPRVFPVLGGTLQCLGCQFTPTPATFFLSDSIDELLLFVSASSLAALDGTDVADARP